MMNFSGKKARRLRNIVIPKSVTSIMMSTFKDCKNLIIYCETSEVPVGWHTDWNLSNRPVYFEGEWEYDANGNPVQLN